jgi:steroid delta-isomerase-like uncharacterized protein
MRKNCIRAALFLVLVGLLLLAPTRVLAGGNEKNAATARKLFEVALNQDNWDVYNEIHTADFIAHAGKRSVGLAEDLQSAKGWRRAFPDGHYSIDQILADGDYIVVRYTAHGANTAAGNGLPATGKTLELTAITVFRFADGKIAEEWTEYNMLSLLKQLGLVPPEMK